MSASSKAGRQPEKSEPIGEACPFEGVEMPLGIHCNCYYYGRTCHHCGAERRQGEERSK